VTTARPLPGAYAYAPEIAIYVDNKELPLADVIDLKVSLEKDQLGGFSLQLANAEPRFVLADNAASPFKYSDSSLLDVGTGLVIEMGYAGRVRKMLSGLIKTFSPSFPSSGLPTISISGADKLSLFQGFKPGSGDSKAFPKMKDWEIAQKIAKRHNLDIEVTQEGPEHPIVMQKDQDDLEFLLERAKRVGFDCYVEFDKDAKKDKLYFIKPKDQRDTRDVDVFAYRWGESLQSFTPKMTVGRQVAKVTVRGWDSRTKEKIEYTAEVADLPRTGGKGRTGAEIVAQKLGAKEERVVDIPVTSREDAKKIAVGLLERNANEFLTGTGEVIGDPDLRPGVIVQLDGLGKRFSGKYTVRKAEHSFGSSGYMTTFEVERLREEQEPEKAK